VRTRKAILNLATSILRNVTGLLLGMITTPIILHYLGEERFGILRVLQDWLGQLTLMEFGLYGAIMSFMAKVLGEKKGQIGQALRISILKYRNVLMMQILGVAVFCVFFERLVPVSPELQRETWIAFFVMATSIFFIFGQIFRAQLEADQRGYIVSYVLMFQNVFYAVIAILFLLQGWSLIGQAVAYALSIAASFLVYLWVARDQLRFLKIKSERFSEEKTFTKQRLSLFISETCGRISLLTDNLMITFVMGTKEVTAFYLTQRLIQVLQSQLQNVSNAAWPALGELYYQKQMDVFRLRVMELTELVAFLSGVSLSVLVVFNPSFIFLWTGERTFAGEWVSHIAAINAGFFALMSLWSWCFTATNSTALITKVFVGQALINFPLSYILTKQFGFVGPLAGSLVSYVVLAIWWSAHILCKTFSIPVMKFHRMWILPFVLPVGLSIAGVTYWGFPRLENWWQLFWQAGLSTAVVAVTCYYLLLSRATKDLLIERIKGSRFLARLR
jgi:O-antigen/teichoic acid export membrane protein